MATFEIQISSLKNTVSSILEQLFECKLTRKPELIQELWSGYGELNRYYLENHEFDSVIVKHIQFPTQNQHPRGWNTDTSHFRKVKSYEIELEWYRNWAKKCTDNCRVPKCYGIKTEGEEQVLVLEDLDAMGFALRKSSLTVEQAKLGLKWLAHFHATFMENTPQNLWKEGSYWHLETRPDELEVMKAGRLKNKAAEIASSLANSEFQTIIHGDAKVANFCFSEDMKHIAAVDFQYVGGGCGMKDLAYFLGSCMIEQNCENSEEELLGYYFEELEKGLILNKDQLDFNALEKEWRYLYAFAWADFSRFLLGWMPTHQKLNSYSKRMVEQVLESLKE